MKLRGIAAIVGLILVGALAAPTAASQQRPMEGKFTGVGAPAEQRCPGALTIGHEVSGTATHLGQFAGSGTNCTEFTLATESVAIWDVIVVIEAADGSTLLLTGDGRQEAPVNGVASYVHVDTVVGGTGRFTDAQGVITVSGSIDFATFEITGTISGWLSY
ncbi:MAG: hypothetical protein L0221_16715 [Chloroflexi bacterium]|nr:hypothetical protein [Chloroflexota bacterium]